MHAKGDQPGLNAARFELLLFPLSAALARRAPTDGLPRGRPHDAGPSEYAGGIEVDLKVALAGLAAERVAGYPARKEDPDDGDGVTITSAVGALACLR